LQIPAGTVINYGQLATVLNRPRAARAVGNAIAANPIAYLIPCHRVIQQTGAIGKYHWDPIRKQAIQIWEAAQRQP
jgi:AraC family transcriptional regulator of adaptative response/methylated-DNA-[protein]-cysteine methyltransferase